MAIARPILSTISIILLAGGIVLTFFIILSGAHIYNVPINLVYWLQASLDNVDSSSNNYANPARWTSLAICGVNNGHNVNCGPTHAAQSFDPSKNFGTSSGLPSAFVNSNHYYYLSRFAWAFYIIALFFAVVSFFLSALALCTRLGSYLTGLMVMIALFFQSLCSSLHTAWVVQAVKTFRNNGQTASYGKYALGFSWATWACYFLAAVMFCLGGALSKKSEKSYQKKSYFGRKRSTRSTRSRGSFIDNESQRRVKDEYE